MDSQNTYFIKIQGKANIPIPLHIGHNYKLMCDCSVTQEQKDDAENGSYDITYKIVPITAEISVDNGPTIKAKDPRKNSTKIRNFLWKTYFNEGGVQDFDKVYDEATWVILSMMPAIYREAVKRLENKNEN